MLIYLTNLLRRAGKEPVHVRYLSRAESEAAWYDAMLLSVDAQGVTFLRGGDDHRIAECLPWGSIAAIQVAVEQEGSDQGR